VIHEGGDNLSGGQKQRLNIARAIIRNTPIVILDEPATGLDAQAETQINAALHHLTQGKTTIIIAHKLSTITSADKILQLAEGELECQSARAQYREPYGAQSRQQSQVAAIASASGEKMAV
jgi:ATP-binding cassette subfamily B protein